MQATIGSIIETMDQNMQISNKDKDFYIADDGLKHCKVCKGYLETIINNPFTGEPKKVNCICSCTEKKWQEEEERKRNIAKQREIMKLQKDSLLGERYKDVSFDNTELGKNKMFDAAFTRCKNYCSISNTILEKGYGIYIYGDKGTGKTHLTACIVNELVKQYKPVLFTNFFEISKMIRSTYNKSSQSEMDFINKLANIDFLIIDDIGSEILKKDDQDTWLQGIIFDIINKRYNNKKPTIFTSNHSLPELVNQRYIMPKTIDRIAQMSNALLKIEGNSYRLEARETELPF